MEDFATFQQSVQSALISTTRSASTLLNHDLAFHRSLSSALGSKLDRQNERLAALAQGLFSVATSGEASVRLPARAPSLKDVEDIDGNWKTVVDVVDSLLERADIALDEFTGAVKRLTPDREMQNAASKTVRPTSKIAQQLRAQDMDKPQLRFENVPSNRETEPFKPLLLSKPHATLPSSSQPLAADGISAQTTGFSTYWPHPYQTEIENYQYPASVYMSSTPTPYHPFESTSATFVDTEEAVDEMLAVLREAKEIAIDLEHHDQRSYAGIVCLMQISTRDRDWIVDTLKPWRRKLERLNEVFADPAIIKVLHGAYMDIVWLQRDLGLYVVGLFDTHYAARALGYAGGSLAFLLKKFVNVDAKKEYQMSDWRIRPLPQELLDYARSDTHYLLYIYDCMRNELIERSDYSLANNEGDKILQVLGKSLETALQRYEYPTYDTELGQGPVGWYKLLLRTPALFAKDQFAVFRAVHQWRDEVAREQDDSVHYVMPSHQVFSLGREMPTNRAALLGLAQPTSQTLRLRTDELVSVIVNAKESGINGPAMLDMLNKIEPQKWKDGNTKEVTSHSVAAYVPSKPSASASGSVTSSLPLRSTTSAFWGSAFGSGKVEAERRSLSTVPHISMTVPLPPLTADVFDAISERPSMEHDRDIGNVNRASTAPLSEREEDGVFILNEMGKNRKRKAPSPDSVDALAKQSDEVVIPDEEAERLQQRAERKKARKEAKRAAKDATATTQNGMADNINASAMDQEPFDYASTPSMLNPPRNDARHMPERRKQHNPYAKSLDAPKGVPRNPAGKERAGRSMTFK